MDRSHDQMIARALEMHPDLLPVAPELLADFDALGSEPEAVVEVLREVGVGAGHRVVDLGCGKGAISRAVARELGCRVVGVELFPPFVSEARSLAAEAGLTDLVTFAPGDAAAPPSSDLVGDVVIFAAMGDLLGPLDEAIASLRRWVRPGGFVVIDDSVLVDDALPREAGYETYTDLAGSRTRLEAHGDRIVFEKREAGADAAHGESESRNERESEHDHESGNTELAALRTRAAGVAARRPELAGALADFIAEQARQYEFLEEGMAGVVWVVEVRGGEGASPEEAKDTGEGEITTLEELLDRLAAVGNGDRSARGTDTEAGRGGTEQSPGGDETGQGDNTGDEDPVTLGEMLDAVGRRSFGPLLLLAGLVIVAPVVGDIPTVPTMMAVVIFLVAVQLLARREEFWLPGWLTRRSVKRKRVRSAVERLRKPTRWVDRLLRRRLTALTGSTGSMVIAATCALVALAIPPMEFVPFTATFAGIAISGFGLALITQDGLVALLAFIVTGSALAWAISAVI